MHDDQKHLREHLFELLDGRSAHIDLETAIRGFPKEFVNSRPAGSPHTAWELLEHIRLAQWDILEFSRDADHVSPEFPDGYWNKKEASDEDWDRSVAQVLDDLAAMRALVADESVDLLARIPHGDGQTVFREALVLADHNAYHVGQIMLLQRMLESEQP